MSRVRCAIDNRKSSEEGLDQEFNSLDAQHEACKAHVASQRHEGWSLNRERYDDGGISGGTMARPGLEALLADVGSGKVDVIVIYKIDRLTRSLADFASIVEMLKKNGASFVSVTQSFNTKTSMGNDHRQRRELVIERVRKVTIGDGCLNLLLNDGTIHERSLERVRYGNDSKLVVGDLAAIDDPKPDPQLVVLLKDAFRAQALAMAKPNFTLERLSKLFGRSTERYKRLLRLSYLSPTIVSAIVGGEQPKHLTSRYLQHLDGLPLSWTDQESLLLR